MMAQLRDKKTSQIIFEGSALEVAALAEKLGLNEILFDDVGDGFNHKEVLDTHSEEVSSLRDMVKSKDKNLKQLAQDKLKTFDTAKGELTKTEKEVKAALKDARANIE